MENIKQSISDLVVSLFPKYRKALVAFVLTAFISFLARNGANLSPDVTDAIKTLIDAALVTFTVWLVPNSKK